jgi:hypothetical protein
MTARIIPFPGKSGVLVTHPSISRFIDPALIPMGDVAMTRETAAALFLAYEPAAQNVVELRKPTYQPEGV